MHYPPHAVQNRPTTEGVRLHRPASVFLDDLHATSPPTFFGYPTDLKVRLYDLDIYDLDTKPADVEAHFQVRHAVHEGYVSLRPVAALETQLVEEALVVAPLGLHLHVQIEIDAAAEEPLQLRPRGGADLLDHRPAPADDDRLL